MIHRPLKALFLSCALLFPAAVLPAQERAARPETPRTAMKSLDKQLKSVKAFLAAPKGDAPLADVHGMVVAVLEAKSKNPRSAAQQPDDKRAAFLAGYHKKLNEVVRHLLDLDEAMEAGDWAAAGEIVKKLDGDKKEGHDAYKGRGRGEGDDDEGGKGEGRGKAEGGGRGHG